MGNFPSSPLPKNRRGLTRGEMSGHGHGHDSKCCQSYYKCPCGCETPYHLPPPEQEYRSSGRRSPLFGHEPQCYSWDNKCHCASSQPYQLPPEGSGEPALSVKLSTQQVRHLYLYNKKDIQDHPVLTTHHALTSQFPSHSNSSDDHTPSSSPRHEWAREASGGHGPVPAQTPLPAHSRGSDLPPSYESLFGSQQARPEGGPTHYYKGT